MIVASQAYQYNDLSYIIRSAVINDAFQLANLRLKIDGETENLDREQGEAHIDPIGFEQLICSDRERDNHLFLVVELNGELVGFSRCEGGSLKRRAHNVEFGLCILKQYWGYHMGTHLIQQSIEWAKANQFKKMNLSVLETNIAAINLYTKFGFEIEGKLRYDKLLSDGKYYDTLLMGKWLEFNN